jgi:hypothetical protein
MVMQIWRTNWLPGCHPSAATLNRSFPPNPRLSHCPARRGTAHAFARHRDNRRLQRDEFVPAFQHENQ